MRARPTTRLSPATSQPATYGRAKGSSSRRRRTTSRRSRSSRQPQRQRFAAVYRGSNPESPQQLYGRSAVARITIKSISAINKNVVSVRYLREVRRGEEVKATHWISTLTYAYAKSPASMGDRLVNPLGFTVSEYRSDPEVVQ